MILTKPIIFIQEDDMKASVYARISREEQSVYSLQEQVNQCMQYIQAEGHELVDTYIDEGYSAKNTNRPQLQKMMNDAREKKFQILIIWKLDRLTRNTLDGLKMVHEIFKPNGIEFASITEDIDTSSPDGFMMFTIRLSMAQSEREKIRERVILGQVARARSGGRNTSIPPYGYTCGDNLELIVDEEKSEVVRRIFREFVNGSGQAKICFGLMEDKIPAPRGGYVWHSNAVATIIRNRAYIGETDWKQKEHAEELRISVPGTHEPIIERDVFDKAQDYSQRKREHSMSQSSYDFPFSTIVKCGICGCSFHGRYIQFKGVKRSPLRNYYCHGTKHPKKCDSSTISERKLTKLIFETIQFEFHEIDPNKEIEDEKPDVAKERKRIEKELLKSKEKQMKLAKAMSSGNIDFDIYVQLREEEKLRVEVMEQQLADLPKEEKNDTRRIGEIVEELKNLKRDWHTWSYIEQKVRMQKIFKRITIVKVGKTWRIEEIEINA
jgi:site-specific DNA recombinase